MEEAAHTLNHLLCVDNACPVVLHDVQELGVDLRIVAKRTLHLIEVLYGARLKVRLYVHVFEHFGGAWIKSGFNRGHNILNMIAHVGIPFFDVRSCCCPLYST